MNKPDLALNNLQWLICHKTKSNQTKSLKLDPHPQMQFTVIRRIPPVGTGIQSAYSVPPDRVTKSSDSR